MKRALVIFAREPLPGKVKTRLAASIGHQAATDLYTAMLQDVQRMATGLESAQGILFWTEDATLPQTLQTAPQLTSYRQTGNDLGERMANAFASVFADGFDACCIIGSDAPDLPPDIVMQAFESLETDMADVVFGPAIDGGYYLIGMRRLWDGVFDRVPWSVPETLDKNLQRAAELGLRSTLLPAWHDIDTVEDLEFFCRNNTNAGLATYRAAERMFPEFRHSAIHKCAKWRSGLG